MQVGLRKLYAQLFAFDVEFVNPKHAITFSIKVHELVSQFLFQVSLFVQLTQLILA